MLYAIILPGAGNHPNKNLSCSILEYPSLRILKTDVKVSYLQTRKQLQIWFEKSGFSHPDVNKTATILATQVAITKSANKLNPNCTLDLPMIIRLQAHSIPTLVNKMINGNNELLVNDLAIDWIKSMGLEIVQAGLKYCLTTPAKSTIPVTLTTTTTPNNTNNTIVGFNEPKPSILLKPLPNKPVFVNPLVEGEQLAKRWFNFLQDVATTNSFNLSARTYSVILKTIKNSTPETMKEAVAEYIYNRYRFSSYFAEGANVIKDKMKSGEFAILVEDTKNLVENQLFKIATINSRLRIWVGKPGTGKTQEAIRLAIEKNKELNLPDLYYEVSCKRTMEAEDMITRVTFPVGSTGPVNCPQPLALAMDNGSICVLDEFSSILSSVIPDFQCLFDNQKYYITPDGVAHQIKDGFEAICTMNDIVNETPVIINDALLDRATEIRTFNFDPMTLNKYTVTDIDTLADSAKKEYDKVLAKYKEDVKAINEENAKTQEEYQKQLNTWEERKKEFIKNNPITPEPSNTNSTPITSAIYDNYSELNNLTQSVYDLLAKNK